VSSSVVGASAGPGSVAKVLFGIGRLQTTRADVPNLLRHAEAADEAGLDLVSVTDHPYLAESIDAYAALGVVLGRTSRVSGVVNVTNLPARPAPVLARTVAGLSAMSGGRIVLGIGAGGIWDKIAQLGITVLSPGEAVRALEEAIVLIRALTGGGDAVDFDGEFYRVKGLAPSDVPTPPVWTGSIGPKSLAVTGRVADGWLPSGGADWLSSTVATGRSIIEQAAVAVGRQPTDVATIYNLIGPITDAPVAATRDGDGRWLGGSVDQWVEELSTAAIDHAAAGFIYFRRNDPAPEDVTVRRWIDEIVPRVREAIGST
jgi:alkanesulfonate monooxygenase SsuD/methylene tetrahydromethanopterin reductase-like flavin-dependent oxidoreductase (luciferase family)